ncbi:MAG: sulfur-carrier protein [Frankiaceae bacterium]|nr:sulfur-carrier protein [Frankiaceae bacterium]MDQ1724465.1 sulfur-carrier protein [Frankiaceae bacterium]
MQDGAVQIRVRYWGSAREAAGRAEDVVEAAGLREAVAAVADRYGERFRRIVEMSTIVVDGERLPPHAKVAVHEGSVVEVMPPFAGG